MSQTSIVTILYSASQDGQVKGIGFESLIVQNGKVTAGNYEIGDGAVTCCTVPNVRRFRGLPLLPQRQPTAPAKGVIDSQSDR